MKVLYVVTLVCLGSILTSSCGKGGGGGGGGGGSALDSRSLKSAPIALTVNSAMSPEMQSTLINDLHAIQTLSEVSDNESEITSMMSLDNSNGPSLLQWIEDRVSYVSGPVSNNEMQDGARFFSIISNRINLEPLSAVKVSTIAANLGSALYISAKKSGVRAQYDFSKSKTIDIRSPRVGLIILFEPYFDYKTFGINTSKEDAFSNSMARMSTLVHEARHSDGNNDSLGFPHVVCPGSKPEYKGSMACDKAENGAYAIEAALHKKFIAECLVRDCTLTEIAILKAYRADYLYRLLDGAGYTAVSWDPNPEALQ